MTPDQFVIRIAGRRFDSIYPRFVTFYWPRCIAWNVLYVRLVKLEGLQ